MTVDGPAAARSAPGTGGLIAAIDLWRHELGRARTGCLAVGLFAAVWICYLAVLPLTSARLDNWHDLRQPGWTMLQGFLPLVGGLAVAAVAAPGQTVELHLSLPVSLRATLARRIALVAAPSFALALMGWLVLDPAGLWNESRGSTLLEIVAPLLFYAAAAAAVAALTGSSRPAAAAVIVAGIAELLLQKSDLVLLIAGAVALAGAWLLLRSEEHLLRSAVSS